ncbi:MAG: sulfatase [Candidatus Aminicenantaceae bacterium]
MRIRFPKYTAIPGSVILILLFSSDSCVNSRTEPAEILRIIDLMRPEYVSTSPMKDLVLRFRLVEENLSERWRFVTGLSSNTQKVWGASTGFAVLGDPDSPEQDDVRLLRGGQAVPYLGSAPQDVMSWRLVQTAEAFDLRQQPDFDQDAQGIVLKKGRALRFEKLLPDREVTLQLYIQNANWKSYRPRIQVLLDDEPIEEFVVSRKRWFRIRLTPNLGFHEIEVRFLGEEGGDPDEFVLIGNARVDSPSEVVLLSLDQAHSNQPPSGDSVLYYHRSDALEAGENPAELERLTSLYFYSRGHLLELNGEDGSDPYRLRQKVVLDEYSLNALLAPTHSEYALPLDIPARARLDFGLGFIHLSRKETEVPPLRYQVKIAVSGQETVLFELETGPDSLDKGFIMQQVDLIPFAGKEAVLSFVTQSLHPEGVEDIGIPVWINPEIYPLPEQPPANIVLVSLDTLRPDFLGCYGYSKPTSPALDALAAEAALFLKAYSTTSWTLPAHVSLLTGLDGLRHEVYYPQEKFDPATPTLAKLLRRRGYSTAAFTGGGYLSNVYGFSQGFDTYQEIRLHGNRAIRLDEAERLAELACDWIEINRDKPFFLFLHTYQPHDPYANLSPLGKMFLAESAPWDQARMESLFQDQGRFNTGFTPEEKDNIVGLYEGEIRYTDEMFVLPVLEALKESGLYENTLVIFLSDHGEEFYDHESWLHDHSLYEEGIRIPLIIKFPQGRFSGQRVTDVMRITDIMPTVLDFAGIEPEGFDLDGESLFPLLEGRERQPRTVLTDLALRQFPDPPTVISLVRDNLKVIVHKRLGSPYAERIAREINDYHVELYDLEQDPRETKNLAQDSSYRAEVVQFIREIHALFQEARDSRTQKNQVEMDRSLEERLRALGYIK